MSLASATRASGDADCDSPPGPESSLPSTIALSWCSARARTFGIASTLNLLASIRRKYPSCGLDALSAEMRSLDTTNSCPNPLSN